MPIYDLPRTPQAHAIQGMATPRRLMFECAECAAALTIDLASDRGGAQPDVMGPAWAHEAAHLLAAAGWEMAGTMGGRQYVSLCPHCAGNQYRLEVDAIGPKTYVIVTAPIMTSSMGPLIFSPGEIIIRHDLTRYDHGTSRMESASLTSLDGRRTMLRGNRVGAAPYRLLSIYADATSHPKIGPIGADVKITGGDISGIFLGATAEGAHIAHQDDTGTWKIESTDPANVEPIQPAGSWPNHDDGTYFLEKGNRSIFLWKRNSGPNRKDRAIGSASPHYSGHWYALIDQPYDPDTDSDARPVAENATEAAAVAALWRHRHEAYTGD